MTIRFIIIILITSVVFTSCRAKSADELVAESVELAKKGDCRHAIELIDKAVKLNPNHRGAFLNRGLCHEKLKDLKSAISDYNKLLEIDSKNTAALYNIGTCKYDLNLFQEAIDYYNKALHTKGVPADTSNSSNPIITVTWNNDQIVEDAKFDIPLYEIFYQRGLAYYQENDFRDSYKDFKRCLIVDEYKVNSQFMIALCFIESGDKKRGCEELDKSIALGDTVAIRKKQEVCK